MSKQAESGENKNLVALCPILYHSRQYKAGETLPVNDQEMANAWLESGTAEWKEGAEEDKQENAPKAVLKTAEAGRTGQVDAGEMSEEGDLVGKIPKTAARKRK